MITLVIVDYKSYDKTINYIVHILRKCLNDNISVIIVDNSLDKENFNGFLKSSNINLIDVRYKNDIRIEKGSILVNNKKYEILIAENNINGGYAIGNNLGFRLAEEYFNSKYVIFSNNDLKVIDEKIDFSSWISYMNLEPDIAVIGPEILGLDGKRQSPCKRISIEEKWIINSLVYPFNKYFNSCNGDDLINVKSNTYVYRIQGSFMFCNAEKFKNAGMFDENTFLYSEEAILSERVQSIGYKILYNSDIKLLHQHSKTINNYFKGIKQDRLKLKSDIYYYKYYLKCSIWKIYFAKICLETYYIKKYLVNIIKKFTKIKNGGKNERNN